MAAAIAFTVVSGLLLVWMLVLARHAWRTLPPGAQVPVHGGPHGWDQWGPKEMALRLWAGIGAAIWVVNLGIMIYAVTDATARSRGASTALQIVLVIPMLVLAISEHYAVKAAYAASPSDPSA
jgi:hypothetical protein